VDLEVRFLRAGAFDVQNIITIAHTKLLRKLGDLTPEQLAEVEEVLLFWLGFEEETAENGQ
jgi:mRNA interferase MazF